MIYGGLRICALKKSFLNLKRANLKKLMKMQIQKVKEMHSLSPFRGRQGQMALNTKQQKF